MRVKVEKIHVSSPLFCVSDIHGSLSLLKEGLQKAHFHHSDTLVVLGDMIEKGEDSLGVIRFLMDLQKQQAVYAIKGNCEAWILYLLKEPNALREYLQQRKESLFWDMIHELQYEYISEKTEELITILIQEYADIFAWIENLPHILEQDDMLFVHAGIKSEKLDENTIDDCLLYSNFEWNAPNLQKYVMVGHLPTVNYCRAIPDCNPRVNLETKTVSIDGGMNVKPDGQLNIFVLESFKPIRYRYESMETTKTMVVEKEQKESMKSCSITWIDNKIHILDETNTQYYIQHDSSQYSMWVDKDYVFQAEDGYHVYDVTDYRLPLQKGDIVYVYKEKANSCLVKKDGIIGWYDL